MSQCVGEAARCHNKATAVSPAQLILLVSLSIALLRCGANVPATSEPAIMVDRFQQQQGGSAVFTLGEVALAYASTNHYSLPII
jgi:hypothetical protein